MKHLLTTFIALGIFASIALAAPEIGTSAPDFTATDTTGKIHKLSDLKGKFVVLEWFNEDCPFIKKHYSSDNMQALQRMCADKNIVWFSIRSSKPGTQGYATPEDAEKIHTDHKSAATAILMDPEGAIGRLYAAKVTPHMFIINPEGTLIYNGAIDDKKSTDTTDIPTAKNYVSQALDEALAGKPVSEPTSTAYGCSIKY